MTTRDFVFGIISRRLEERFKSEYISERTLYAMDDLISCVLEDLYRRQPNYYPKTYKLRIGVTLDPENQSSIIFAPKDKKTQCYLKYSKQMIGEDNLNNQKKYTHNCKDCVFLGEFQEDDLQYDLYSCSQSGMPTVIARYGDASGDYLSGLPSQHPALDEAKHRADALELSI